jgi:hypothetical protein
MAREGGAAWLIGQGASMAAEPRKQQHRWVGLKGKRQWQQQQNWDGMGRGHMADGQGASMQQNTGNSNTTGGIGREDTWQQQQFVG